ncbi:DEAD/DEAH box helicase [Halobacillus naozhouensis]|uniref:DEAD/DEAH box helicase n=1 Tax=Halobacillus naozhouensis TaxID=554880 RepID=A0ABY8IZK8_9BACI|nr:DEAD/DEAH box helicase [Halobacillus naozhouensis]WFT74634.1 DEAD/DEAH box helicase [Halobacillus naozhouensis]
MNESSEPSWFQNMAPFLKEAWERSSFKQPTSVQLNAIPFIKAGQDVIAEAPTGSGKTLAYLWPLLGQIDPVKKHAQVLVLASSHELVMQIHQEVQTWSKNSGITSTTLIGGANVKRQIEKLKKKPQMVIGTPGRVYELMKQKKLKAHEINTIVLDEADQLLVSEHIETVQNIVKATLKERQILLFSATLPEEVETSAQEFMKEPEIVRIKKEALRPDAAHAYISTQDRDKLETLRKLARMESFKGLAFVGDIGNLSVYAEKIRYKGLDLEILHSDAKKEERARALKRFRNGDITLLLATDVAARGLDIKDITHIVNLNVPKVPSDYIHRAGRTGRLGSHSGTVVSLVNPVEEKRLKKYARDFNFRLEKKEMYKGMLTHCE